MEDLRICNLSRNEGFGPHGIYASRNVTGSYFLRNRFESIGLQSAWGAGIRIGEGGRGNLIEGNSVRGVGRGGILTTHGSTDTRIVNNQVRDFGFAGPGLGIEIWGNGQRAVIEDNRVDHWISLDGQTDVAVRRNTITGSEDPTRIGSYGLELVNSQRVGNIVSGNRGGDRHVRSKGFEELWMALAARRSPRRAGPELRITISGQRRAGRAVAFRLDGPATEQLTEVLWDLGEGIPATGKAVEHVYPASGRYAVAAIAWTTGGRGILAQAEVIVQDE